MLKHESLKPRHWDVLSSVVRQYIETGEPIGSRTISQAGSQRLSAASIRNLMGDLADEGYLSQPHTSAGRVPTEKAFRYYVGSLTARRMAQAEAERLHLEIAGLDTVAERVERSSHILVELTRNVGIAVALAPAGQQLDQIELVPLADQRVLIVLVTRDHMVRHRVVRLDEPSDPEELASIRNYVNRNFAGWRLGEARRELVRRLEEERALYDAVNGKLQALCQKGLLVVDTSPEVHMDGASNLLGLDLHLTREKMRQLLQALEEKARLIDMLDLFLEQPPGELGVHVGLEQVHPAMKELVLIGVTVDIGSGVPAKVAVLGPMRMRYERVMAAVLETSRALAGIPF